MLGIQSIPNSSVQSLCGAWLLQEDGALPNPGSQCAGLHYVTSHENHRETRLDGAHLRISFRPAYERHRNVQNHELNFVRFRLEHTYGVPAVAGENYTVAPREQSLTNQFPKTIVIIGHED